MSKCCPKASPVKFRQTLLFCKHLGQLPVQLLIMYLAVFGGCQECVVQIKHQDEAIASQDPFQALVPAAVSSNAWAS